MMDSDISSQIAFLSEMEEQDRRDFLALAKSIPVRIDHEVIRQGQHNESLFIVVEGVLHVRRGGKGHEVLLGRLEPGSFFGEVSLFDPGPTTATVRAVSDGKLLRIDRSEMLSFAKSHPAGAAALLLGIASQMAQRMRNLDQRLVDSVVWGLLK